MTHNVYLYIAIMAGVSFAIRVLPLTLIRRPITNRFLRSFVYYVPYVTLAVVTFPAIAEATQTPARLRWWWASRWHLAARACSRCRPHAV